MPSKFLNHHRTPTMWTAEVQYALVGTHTIHAHSYRTHEATSRARTAHLRQTHTHTLCRYMLQYSPAQPPPRVNNPYHGATTAQGSAGQNQSNPPSLKYCYSTLTTYSTPTQCVHAHVTYLRCRQHCLVSNGQTRRPEQPDQGSTVQ